MTTRDLATTDRGALAAWQGFEWESDGTEDIAPSFPVIKIVQPTSSMEGASKHGGEFYRTDTGEFYAHLDVVPLVQRETRALFEEGHDLPSCLSVDGHVPLPNQPLWTDDPNGQPLNCDTDCPMSQWIDNEPPRCKLSYVVLCDLDGELVQLRIGGKSMKPWKNYVARRLRPRKLPLCSHNLTLKTVERNEPGKRWNELVIEPTPLTPEEASLYNAAIATEKQRFERSVHAAATQADEGGEAGPGQWQEAGTVDVTPPRQAAAFADVD